MNRIYTSLSGVRMAALAAIMATPLLAGAVPAKPGIVTLTTPDGRELRLEKRGGPFAHATFTDDGLLLSELPDGTYVYARVGDDGLPEPTDIRACAAEFRTGSELSFTARLREQDFVRALSARDAAVASAMKAPSGVIKRERAENPGLCKTSMPTRTGSPKCLVVLVEFLDEKFRTENAHEYFSNSLNQKGFDSGKWQGSVLDYFTENSNGVYTPQFDVYGPVPLDKNMSYYGGNDRNGNDLRPHEMVSDACRILDETTDINFADYDNDGDGIVDNVFIYFAGYGEANSQGRPNTVWPHSHDLSVAEPRKKFIFDDVRIDHYACCNEVEEVTPKSDDWRLEGIGTFVHEFSHVLGLPDLYETSYATGSFTPGFYSILDYGPYNNDGHTPPNYGAYERYALGWLTPDELYNSGEITLPPITDTNRAYMVNTPRDNEYFLFENRRLEGWDKFIPAEGMLVYHIDFSPTIFEQNIVNNDPNHQYVDLIEADNRRDARSREGDVFPGSAGVTSLGFNTTPALKSWNNKNLMRELTDIRHEGRDIKFTLTNTDPEYVDLAVEGVTGENGAFSFVQGCIVSSYMESLDVFDTFGRRVATVAPGATVELPAGLYIVTTPDGAKKIRL